MDRGHNQKIDIQRAEKFCKKFRQRILDISQNVGALHIAPAFSCLEILYSIYFELLPKDKKSDNSFILSKGHGAIGLYVILEELEVLSPTDLDQYCTKNGILGAHPDRGNPGISASTGSLGHGLGIASGIAYARKLIEDDREVYVLVSDGELQEGSTWEAIMMASNLKLDNLIVYVDSNDFGGLHRMSDHHTSFYPIEEKFKSFGWSCETIDGHDVDACYQASFKRVDNKPHVVIANTIKGKGVSFMENVPIWHYRSPNKEELAIARSEIGEKAK